LNNDKDIAFDIVNKYEAMIMKHWKKCSNAITFDEMVNEIYLNLRKNPVKETMSHEQVTKYIYNICSQLKSGAWVYGSNIGAVLGAELSKCRGSRASAFENKQERMKRETKSGRTTDFHMRGTLFTSGEEVSEDDRSTLMDIEDNLSGTEKRIADLIVEGYTVGQISKKLGLHRWTIKKQYLPRIAKRLGLVDPNK
jgi:hypothetical protein